MLDKINISNIVRDHFKTLVNADTNKFGWGDLSISLLLPLTISFLLSYSGLFLSTNLVNALIAVLAIWVALLLNLLVIIFDTILKLKENQKKQLAEEKNKTQLKKVFLNEIYANISFSILLSIVSILALLFCLSDNKIVLEISNFISYYLLLLFLVTLLMVLKRVHILLTKEFSEE